MSRISYYVINGSRTGLHRYYLDQLKLKKDTVYLMDIPEETLWILREKFPGTEASYLYDPKDLEGKNIHDIGPVLNLYNSFIKVNVEKNNIFDLY